jgi:hypothetical protein
MGCLGFGTSWRDQKISRSGCPEVLLKHYAPSTILIDERRTSNVQHRIKNKIPTPILDKVKFQTFFQIKILSKQQVLPLKNLKSSQYSKNPNNCNIGLVQAQMPERFLIQSTSFPRKRESRRFFLDPHLAETAAGCPPTRA